MKKLRFIISVLSLFLIISCDKEIINELTKPRLIVSADTLSFYGNETKTLLLSTNPATECNFQITSFPQWVKVYPQSGSINRNIKEITITSEINFDVLDWDYRELIIVSSLGIDTVILERGTGKHLSYSIPESLLIPTFNDSESLFIRNKGNSNLHYSLTTSSDLLSLSASEGEIAKGEQKEILVNVNRGQLQSGTYYADIYVTIDEKEETIPVQIENLKEEKRFLSASVIDAEYSKINNSLVYISDDLFVNIYHPQSNAIEKIPLDFVPTCLSLSLTEEKAAIGHDGHMSYIDLREKKVISTHYVSCKSSDIVLSNNGWVYVFPEQNQWSRIHCINTGIENESETLHIGNYIYAGTKAKLHPSGKYIYGADNNLSPSDIEKYNIQNGTAEFMYDSPYHGDYFIDGDLWFSEDGKRVFTRGKTVLRLSETKGQDMLYNGSIKLPNSSQYYNSGIIMWLDHSEARKSLYLLSSADDYWKNINKPYVYIYNSDNLTFKKQIELEEYVVKDIFGKGKVYPAEPHYVFANTNTPEIYVVTKAVGSGLVNEWAIQTIDIR